MELKKFKYYSKDYKTTIVGLIRDENLTVPEASKKFDINARNLYRWISEFSTEENSLKSTTTKESEELRKYKKALADKEEELEILKKAISIFSKKK